jgi:Ca2+-binding RTX toxin-like protein
MPNGTIRYRAVNSVDPVGINGQSVYNGAPGAAVDRIYGGNDSDTFWGGLGNDIIEGGDGADIALGGEGNDIITDLAGDDVPKGGPGNDAIDGGPGLDIIMGGDGNDFTNGGANTNETFGGAGDDFAIAGQGLDAIFGDSGDDWEEGGDQPDLLIGDSSSLFFDDHNLPGHDILIGQGGDDDYDLEGGDDIGVAGPGVEKIAGASGYDWEIGLADPQAQDMDLALVFVAGGVILPGVRDKFNEVEALSGWNFADTLRGDDVVPTAVGGGGFVGCDALDAAGVARIVGLDALVPATSLTVDSAPIIAASATHHCLLTGNVWGDGNILLGGAGSDSLEGRGANDILDGDRYLNVRLSIRTDPALASSQIGSTDLMEHAALTGDFGPGTAGMTLQQAVFAGLVDPGNIVAVREILNPGAGTSVDTALFSGPRSNYTLTRNSNGSVTVADNAAVVAAGDGIDTLWNIEMLSFCLTPGLVKGTCDVRETPPFPTSSIALAAPIALRSPASLAFGNQVILTTSATQVITVSNTGNAPLIVSGATLTGADAASFTITNGCATVAPAGSCTIDIAFAPTTVGPKSAGVSIAHNAAGSPLGVTLTGTALAPPAPIAAVTPASLLFGNQAVSTSAIRVITVTNTGTGPLTVSGATLSGVDAASFTLAPITATTCAAATPVAPAGFCTISVTFLPTSLGPKAASVSIAHNALGSPSIVALSGTAVPPLTTFSLPAGPIAFGTKAINTNNIKTVLVTNTGANPLFITSATAGAPFATVTLGTCSAAVAVGKTCKLNVTFTPTARTAYAGTLTVVSSNATNSPRTVGLTGTGK